MKWAVLALIFLFYWQPVESSPEESMRAFMDIYRVAQHPRCANCHSVTRPKRGDHGKPHPMNITRNITGLGYKCSSCHQEGYEHLPNMPPWALHWSMPHPDKRIEKDKTARQLCEQWKDPRHNVFELGPKTGQGRTLEDIIEHVTNDPLVKWGWEPGLGRTPVHGTHAEFVATVKKWVHTGAHCPK